MEKPGKARREGRLVPSLLPGWANRSGQFAAEFQKESELWVTGKGLNAERLVQSLSRK